VNGREMVGFFRDHYLSDLVGFVYSRMDTYAAADDLYHRIRAIGERVHVGRPLTVSLILDGENAWEYFRGNGREFLRQFYRRIDNDPDIQALTASEAVAAAGEIPRNNGIFPASWISANFDVWIGAAEDVTAWDYLRRARDFYSQQADNAARGFPKAPTAAQLATSYESLLAAEGSDWNWWYGPEHSSANDAEFDAFYRKLLTEVYRSLGGEAPDILAEPIKRQPVPAVFLPPSAFLKVKVDGRESTYFEWMGAGLYSTDRRSSAMHGSLMLLHEIRYGFDEKRFHLRVDVFADALKELHDAEFRITFRAEQELRVVVRFPRPVLTRAGRSCESCVRPDSGSVCRERNVFARQSKIRVSWRCVVGGRAAYGPSPHGGNARDSAWRRQFRLARSAIKTMRKMRANSVRVI
jgi:Glycosyl hydrolase family 57